MAGKWRMLWGSGGMSPGPGSERGGRNVASLHGGRSSPASLRVSGPLVKGVYCEQREQRPFGDLGLGKLLLN